MKQIKALNLGLSFILESCMVASFAYFGFVEEKNTALAWLLGFGLPLVAIIMWAIFAAPKSSRRLPLPNRLIFKLVIYGLAVTALYTAGRHNLAVLFALAVLVNEIFSFVWKQ